MKRFTPDNLLRIMIALLIVWATALLGVGERTASLTLLTIFLAAVSWYVTDYRQLFSLRQPLADCLALGIVAVAAANAYHVDRAGQMLAVADLQSYLQYVLLFQTKTPRVYWQLALLSLGQIAIASALVPGPMFGVMLLGYVLIGLVTFSLQLLCTEGRRCETAGSRAAALAGTGSAALAGGGTVALAAGTSHAKSQAPRLSGRSALGETKTIGWGLFRQAILVAGITIVTAMAVYFALPRWDVQNHEASAVEPLRSVGFSKTVTLGELGGVVNDSDVVMRIMFFHGFDSRPFKLIGEPLFRGTVVTQYDEGQWSQRDAASPVKLPSNNNALFFVRQRITAEPLDVSELFCIYPVFALQPDARLKLDFSRDQLMRDTDHRFDRLEFEVGTDGIQDNKQLTLLPVANKLDDGDIQDMTVISPSRGDGGYPFPTLRATAESVLRERQISPGDRVAAARALNDYLHTSGRFFYSLEPQVRNKALDPLEDFMTEHPSGHCEYFAGALVMMLRSQGIPARMAIGFKGGEWNPVGMYYQVQQLHAHTWVEVYLDGEHIPPGTFDSEDDVRAGWLVLDPTEGTQERNQQTQNTGLLARLRAYKDYSQVLWANYVAGLNASRQQQGIFEPLNAAVGNLVSGEVWQARLQSVSDSGFGRFLTWYRRHWFSWRGGLVAAIFSLIVIGTYLALRRGWNALRRAGLVRAKKDQDERPVLEMYRRLEAALARHGFERKPAQTAYEFAVAAGGDLAESLPHRRVAHLPRRIVEAFYRVRFGGRSLDHSEADAIEQALSEFERAMAGKADAAPA